MKWEGRLTREIVAKRTWPRSASWAAMCGGVTAVQRVSSDQRLNPHFRTLALNGVFVENEAGELALYPLPALANADEADTHRGAKPIRIWLHGPEPCSPPDTARSTDAQPISGGLGGRAATRSRRDNYPDAGGETGCTEQRGGQRHR